MYISYTGPLNVYILYTGPLKVYISYTGPLNAYKRVSKYLGDQKNYIFFSTRYSMKLTPEVNL